MNEIKVSFDNRDNRTKPSIYNLRSIKERVAETIHHVNRDNLKSFVTFVGKNGCTFSSATFKTSFSEIEMNRDNFRQMQLFVLDFNGGISFEEVMSRAMRYDLPILFAYETFGSKNRDRFRIVFLNDASVKYAKVAEIMLEALLTIFPEADLRSKDITQFYFGGKQLLHFDESVQEINIELLFRNMCLYLSDCYGEKNHHRNIHRFSKRTGLALNEKKYFDVSVADSVDAENSVHRCNETLPPNSIIYIIEIGDKVSSEISERTMNSCDSSLKHETSKFFYKMRVNNSFNQESTENLSHSTKKSSVNHLQNRSTDLPEIENECQLFREFKNGSDKLTQDELLGLSTNLIKVESGSASFMKIISEYAYFDSNPKKYSDWKYYLNYMKKNDYKPQPCGKFCPHRNECRHANDILSTSKPKYHTTKKLENCNEQLYSINEAEVDFQLVFKAKMSAPVTDKYKNIHIIKAPTGIGKSTTVLNYMKENPNHKYLVAPPTIDLKNKYYDDAIAQGIKAVKSPSLLEYKDKLPVKVWNRIQGFYQIGKYYSVMEYIKEIITKRDADKDSLMILGNHLKDMAAFYTSDCHSFSTHSMASAMDYWSLKGYDAVIFDEDPILNYMIANQVEIPISKLEEAFGEIETDSRLAKKIRAAAEAAAAGLWFTLQSIPYEEAYIGIPTAIDIPSFCMAEKFYFRKKSGSNNPHENSPKEDSIVFFKRFRLDPRIKYIILSATSDEKICNHCFGANYVDFHTCKIAKYIGTLNQYTQYPMSHDFVNKNPGIVKEILKSNCSDGVITFKGTEYGMDDCHFGKTTGIDKYKGKDLTILGTYHRPEWLYKLFAYTLGDRYFDEHKDAVMRYQPIKHNGFKFHFMTYDESAMLLRNIQLWMVESELEQAVGRARLSRCGCTVNLYSNFLLSQANNINNFERAKE